jgi:hypothetical protein
MGEEVPRVIIALYAEMLKPQVTEITTPKNVNLRIVNIGGYRKCTLLACAATT